MVSVDIVLPVYNEEKILRASVTTLAEFLKSNFSHRWRIVIADNASIDRTLEIARDLSREMAQVEVIHLEMKGRGRAVRRCWLASKADIVSYMDIDLSTDLNAFPVLIDAVVEGYDVATGCRLHKDSQVVRSLKREVLSRGYVLILKTFLGIKFSDAQCGFKAIRTDVFKKMSPKVKDNEWFFDSELLFKAERMRFTIKEIPVKWIEDPDSRVNITRTATNYVLSTFRLMFEYLEEDLYAFYNKPAVSDVVRGILEFGEITVKWKLKKYIGLAHDDKILDVGCGTGTFSKLFNARYCGIDTHVSHLRHAHNKYAGRRKAFFISSAAAIGFADDGFDESLCLSLLHHLPEESITGVLQEVARVTRKRVVILDLVPSDKDPLRKFFYGLDVGKHIRPLQKQLEIVGKVLDVKHYETFRSGVNIHSLIIAVPRKSNHG